MKFRNKTNPEVSVNLTPLIDVVFLLLIFFMVSTTFKNNTQLKIELPYASSEVQDAAKAPIYVTIEANGRYTIQDNEYTKDELTALYAKLSTLKQKKDTQLYIMGDKQAPHQALVNLLEISADLGISNIRILAQHQQTKPYQNAMKQS